MSDKNTNDLSIETSINYLSSKDSNGLSNIFAINGSSSSNIQFSLSERKAAFINEIGVFVVSDDKGTVNGVAPGTQGYMQAAFTQSRVIFSSLSEKASAGINFVRQLSFKAGERLGFYMVANNTTSSVDTTSGKTSDNVFFSLSGCNSDQFDHVRVKDKGKSTFDLAWEDLKGGGDKDFNDLVLKMEIVKTPPALGIGLQGQKEGEVLDFRSVKGQISANFTLNSDSSNRNHVGFYRINDAQGTVTDPLTGKTIKPDEVGYAQAAIRQSIVTFNQSSTSSTSIEGGGLFATYIIANGTSEQFLSLNQSNQEGSGPVAYFTFHKANPDKVQHIRQCGDNTFGFEQPSIKGKREYSYTVFKVDLSVKAEIDIDKGSGDTNSQVGTLAFAAANYSDFEGNSGTVDKVVAKIQRTGSTKGATSVQVQLDDGSTATPNDYTNNLPLTINFADGETTKDVVIPLTGDTTDEMDETIKLKLFDATGGASLGSQQTATYTIINDDALVSIAASGIKATETGTTGTFTISRSTLDTSAELMVNLGIDDSSTVTSNAGGAFAVDYSLSGGGVSGTGKTRSVIIPVGMSKVDITLTALDDTHAEASEILKLNLADGNYKVDTTKNNATVTIAANDTEVINTSDATGTDYTKLEGSLRQALINANAFAGLDNITFNIPTNDSGYTAATGMYTITLASALDNISDDVNITGLGANKLTVSGNDAVRVFSINSGKTVNIDGLTIANGKANQGGGIYNGGTLTLTNSTLAGNSASAGGGGIFNNNGILTLTNSTLAGNSASGGGGGIYNDDGTLKLTNSTLAGNSTNSGGGGGIFNNGTSTVSNSTLADNSASVNYYGGGICNYYGTLTVSNSTLARNSANSGGGGIYNNGGTSTVSNSTLAGNSANSGGGGGIYNLSGTSTVSNSTLADNSAANFGGGGIYNNPSGTVKAKNSIIAKNTASSSNPDFYGTLTSQGYNLIGTTTTGTTSTDIINVNPLLGSLQDNGGATYTMALLPGSVAINAGDPNFTSPPTTDQRGTERIKKGRIDIGAYEYDFTSAN
ncbi:hypothetical protein NIES4075_20020 [Tolypothrix sp. NIES-4075]|uniref:DUF4114 domain-containing protein n=1 Tax=Tolypothrix sp. NIES-4075 TaxID=2005459 RepID=UPI000B5C84BE|nr:DUF4114 domain-containing protein [Tolypothrix sp. NIES-4075]GAX41034.1 hypothetical protein NIES4075_20020 [Tolypothrix sp. NIES-4075]